jgi:hypothetical protein
MAVVAVGSAVRPSVPSVDIDLVVIANQTSSVKKDHPVEVDLRVYPTADIDIEIERRHDMLIWAVLFGKVLYERHHFWESVVDRWRSHLPLPSVELARTRSAAAYRRLTNVLRIGDEDAVVEQALSFFTHLARIELLEKGVYPASRPELPAQLRAVGDSPLAEWLERLYHGKLTQLSEIDALLKSLVCLGDWSSQLIDPSRSFYPQTSR